MRNSDTQAIPILRAPLWRIWLMFLVFSSPLLVLYWTWNSDGVYPRQKAMLVVAALVGILAMATAGLRALRQRTLVSGEPNLLRVSAPSKGITNPRKQTLEGDLSDLTMSIDAAVPPGLARTMNAIPGNAKFSEVIFSGKAGTIKMLVALNSYEVGYEERFAEWKRTMVSSTD